MELLWVGLGGAAGSLTRYVLGQSITKRTNSHFPWGTLIVNISGALLLGIVAGLGVTHDVALLLVDGFLGAYTTFSTFMYEGFHLFRSSRANAATYITGSFVLGLAFFAAGYALAGVAR